MSKIFKSDEAFTGLEAAIVLIAFVVVAAVFSYVVLGAGFFTTQKSQEVVYSSVDMASSSIEVLGDVYGNATGDSEDGIDGLEFVLGLTAGGAPVDLAQTTMVFKNDSAIKDLVRDVNISGQNSTVTVDKSAILSTIYKWGIIDIDNDDSDKGALLENQEQFTVFAHFDNASVAPNERFSLEIKPPVGASYGIKRQAPEKIKAVNILY